MNCRRWLLLLVAAVFVALLSTGFVGTPAVPAVDVPLTDSVPPPTASRAVVAQQNLPHHASRFSITHSSALRESPCVTPVFPDVAFQQVTTYVGPVDVGVIHHTLQRLVSADSSLNGTLRLLFFAVDGTLLNLMRWGRIVNDNDIDLGFLFVDVTTGAMAEAKHPHQPYVWLQQWLFDRRLLDRQKVPRDETKLYNSKKVLKPQTCKFRGQMMQCRLDHSNVIVDWFGPETVFSALGGLSLIDVVPLAMCLADRQTFPCPRRARRVLKAFTLNVGTAGVPKPYHEFRGCALFPKRVEEQDHAHVRAVVETGEALARCGLPNLLQELRDEPQCVDIVARSLRG